jgi:hypothetical protein
MATRRIDGATQRSLPVSNQKRNKNRSDHDAHQRHHQQWVVHRLALVAGRVQDDWL